MKKFLALILAMLMALSLAACGTAEPPATEAPTEAPTTAVTEPEVTEPAESSDVTVLGEGAVSFSFTVTDADGSETKFLINTDAETVGEALLELELIAGGMGDYGLYVKSVNGITADFETEGAYWAFYVDGEYAMTGVDATDITPGATYGFVKTVSE